MGRTLQLGRLAFSDPGSSGLDDVAFTGLALEGWDGSPASSLDLSQRSRAAGGWRSSDPQMTARALALRGVIQGRTPEAVMAAESAVNRAASLDEVALVVGGDGVDPRTMQVSRQGAVIITGTPTQLVKRFSVGLVAADPRKFGAAVTDSTKLPSSVGGLAFPHKVPFLYPAVTVTGQVSIFNPGDVSGPVLVRVSGPCPDFQVTHVGSSGTQVFAMNLPMTDEEFVVIDMENETVRAAGQTSRTQWITSRGFAAFDPGPNTWSFASSTSGPTTARMRVTATPTWM